MTSPIPDLFNTDAPPSNPASFETYEFFKSKTTTTLFSKIINAIRGLFKTSAPTVTPTSKTHTKPRTERTNPHFLPPPESKTTESLFTSLHRINKAIRKFLNITKTPILKKTEDFFEI